MSDKIYWIWLASIDKLGPAKIKPLLEYFGSPEKIYNTDYNDLRDIKGLSAAVIKQLLDKDTTYAQRAIKNAKENGFTILSLFDKKYPDRLRNIYDPPIVLYIKGKLPDIDALPAVGVVGTRNCTPYGVKHAESVGYLLSQNGITVVTGLAQGIDSAAIRGALKGYTPTVGVIASGPDIVFPTCNRSLFDKVSQNGAIVSEYSPGTPAVPGHFPSRNRIISGLSNGIAVIEAPIRSGALITADRAMEQGRDVFALPGNVDAAACMGSNKLLRLGCIPFMSADDIIDEYRDFYKCIKKPIDNSLSVEYIDLDKMTCRLTGNAKKIALSIGFGLVNTTEIIAKTGLDAQNVLSELTIMELDGYLKRDLIGRWEIVK